MAVANKVPETLATYKGTPQAWIEENGKFIASLIEQNDKLLDENKIPLYQKAYDGTLESIEERDKSRGDDINHKLQVGMAQLIIDTIVDYMTGKDISWTVEKPEPIPGEEETQVPEAFVEEYRKKILKLLRSENAQRVLAEQLRQGSIAGYSGVISWVDEEGSIDFEEFPAQEIIPVYDSRGRLKMVLRKYEVVDEADDSGNERTKVEVYDSKFISYFITDESGQNFMLDPDEAETGNPVRHLAGRIPVSLFTNGTPAAYEDRKKRMGVSDIKVIFSLLEDLASTMSDKSNTVDRLLDQFLLFKNVTTTEEEVIKMRRARAIVLKGKESDASFLAPPQEDTAVENHLNRLEEAIHKVSQTPKLNDISGATATEIKVKYASLDIKAGKKELYFTQAIKDFIKILTDLLNAQMILEKNPSADVYEILTGKTEDGGPISSVPLYSADWLDFTINRNMPQNFLEIAQIVSTLVDVVPDSYLYELLWFIPDPVAALDEMRKQRDENSKRQAEAGLGVMGFGGGFSNLNNEGGGGDDDPEEEE